MLRGPTLPPSFGYANKTNQRLKMYNFTIHTVLCSSFSSLSWHRQHNVRCVLEACYCLTQFATHISRLGCRQFTTLQHVYCKSILTAVTCARQVSGQSYPACLTMYVCYRSRLSSNTYIHVELGKQKCGWRYADLLQNYWPFDVTEFLLSPVCL